MRNVELDGGVALEKVEEQVDTRSGGLAGPNVHRLDNSLVVN